jgi:SpoVK/Ycf46/Vps4 family AAA+-type ATPase
MKEHWPLLIAASSAFAVLASAWGRVHSWFVRVRSHVIVTSRLETELTELMLGHLGRVGRRSRLGDRHYRSETYHIRSLGHAKRVVMRFFFNSTQVYWVNGWPVWVTPSQPATTPNTAATLAAFTVIRGTVDLEALMLAAVDIEIDFERRANAGVKHRYEVINIYGQGNRARSPEADGGKQLSTRGATQARLNGSEPLGHEWDDLGPEQAEAALDALALSPELQKVVDIVRQWYRDRKFYEERGIRWFRGFLFHGVTGGGKTTMARSIAEELDLPVFRFDLASMQNYELEEGWQRVRRNMPAMVVFEDFDGVFEGRKNVTNPHNGGGVTFDAVLNGIDGIEKIGGLLLIVTTNKLEHIDPALGLPVKDENGETRSTRPGRIDMVVEFKPLDESGRLKIAKRILRDDVRALELSKLGATDTAAQFTDRCVKLALEERFKEYEAGSVKGPAPVSLHIVEKEPDRNLPNARQVAKMYQR